MPLLDGSVTIPFLLAYNQMLLFSKIQSFLLWTTPSRNLPCFVLSWPRCCPSLPPQHLWPNYLPCCDSPYSSYLSAHIIPHRGYLLLYVYSEVTSPQKHILNSCDSPVTLSTATIKKTACGPSRLTVLILYLGYSHQGKRERSSGDALGNRSF